jgi:hypothetical protein
MDTISRTTPMTMKAVMANPRNPGVTCSAVRPGRRPSLPGAGEGGVVREAMPLAAVITD